MSDPFEDPSYQAFVDACSQHCRCCPRCGDHPCPGSMAGGICDRARCWCDDNDDIDDSYNHWEEA